MALDEPNEQDREFDVSGFKYIVNQTFLDRAQPIKIDFHMYGFKLDCSIDFGSGCAGCSPSTSNSCGC